MLLPNCRHVVVVSLWRHQSCSPFCHVLSGAKSRNAPAVSPFLLFVMFSLAPSVMFSFLSCSLWRQIYYFSELVLVRMYTFFVTMFGDPIQAWTGPKNMDTSTDNNTAITSAIPIFNARDASLVGSGRTPLESARAYASMPPDEVKTEGAWVRTRWRVGQGTIGRLA